MKFLTSILVTALAVLITAELLPGVRVDSLTNALLVAIVLAFLNAIVKPVLTILTIPITFFTLGLFLLVINASLILIAARLIEGFHVRGFWSALVFSLILSIVTGLLNFFLGTGKKTERD